MKKLIAYAGFLIFVIMSNGLIFDGNVMKYGWVAPVIWVVSIGYALKLLKKYLNKND